MSIHMLVAMANQLSDCILLVQAKGSGNILQIILVHIRFQRGSEYFVEGILGTLHLSDMISFFPLYLLLCLCSQVSGDNHLDHWSLLDHWSILRSSLGSPSQLEKSFYTVIRCRTGSWVKHSCLLHVHPMNPVSSLLVGSSVVLKSKCQTPDILQKYEASISWHEIFTGSWGSSSRYPSSISLPCATTDTNLFLVVDYFFDSTFTTWLTKQVAHRNWWNW